MAQDVSPITGILEEDRVYVDFGEHEGKSILEICDTTPDYYQYLIDRKNDGHCMIKRSKDKCYRLYLSPSSIH